MKEIALTQGQVTLVDDADFEWLSQWKWHARLDPPSGKFYATRTSKPKNIQMARVILGLVDSKIEAEHKNCDTLDNQRVNLRAATKSQNAANRNKPKTNTSGFKGVSWSKRLNKWRAAVKYNWKQIHVGYFVSKEDAFAAYQKKAVELHKEFARF
jgi:hypothetical protein